MTIFIVIGSTGEYDDYTEWLVRAFPLENQAELHKNKCQQRADQINKNRKGKPLDYVREKAITNEGEMPSSWINAFDTKMEMDDGTYYHIEELELEGLGIHV